MNTLTEDLLQLLERHRNLFREPFNPARTAQRIVSEYLGDYGYLNDEGAKEIVP